MANEEKQWVDTEYYDYHLGLVSDEDAMKIPDNAVKDCNNVIFKKRGSILKRLGFTMLGAEIPTGSYGVMGLHPYYGEGIKHLLAVVDTSLYRWNTPSWVSITSSLSQNKRTEFANAINKCIIVNSENEPYKLENTTLSVLDTGLDPDDWRPYKADFVRWFHNVLWFGNITENDTPSYTIEGSRVRHSEIRNIEGTGSWVWTYYFDSEADDGFNISGLIPYRNNLLVMKDKRTAMIVGSSHEDFGIFNYDNTVGSPAHRSMQEYYGRVWHLGEKALYSFDGTFNIPFSDDIQDIIDSINKENLYKSASCLWDDKYHISVPIGQTYPNTIVVYDYRNNSFTKYSGINASCFALFKPANEEYLYFGESNSGKINRLFTGYSDNGASIDASFETGKKFTGDKNWINDVRHLWVEATGDASDHLMIKYRFDDNTTYSDGWTCSLSKRFTRFTFPEGSYGRLIQWKVENSSTCSPFEFFGFVISQRKRRPFS